MLWVMNSYVFRFEWDLADRLRKSLRVSGLGVHEIAAALGVSRNTASNWINGRGEPSHNQLAVWAALTDAPVCWLESGERPAAGEGGGCPHRELVAV